MNTNTYKLLFCQGVIVGEPHGGANRRSQTIQLDLHGVRAHCSGWTASSCSSASPDPEEVRRSEDSVTSSSLSRSCFLFGHAARREACSSDPDQLRRSTERSLLVHDFLTMSTDRFGMRIVLSNSRVGHTRRSLNSALMGQQGCWPVHRSPSALS